jgi:hypothetical protein
MQDESNSTPPAVPANIGTPPELPQRPAPPPWSERKGKGLFWCLLFAPALLSLVSLAASLGMQVNSPGLLIAGAVAGLGICLYCGMWMASGFHYSKEAKIFAGIGLALAFALLNGLVFFAGCFAVLMTFQ